jgi:hypothetical protein
LISVFSFALAPIRRGFKSKSCSLYALDTEALLHCYLRPAMAAYRGCYTLLSRA